jgi:hypothetical protein
MAFSRRIYKRFRHAPKSKSTIFRSDWQRYAINSVRLQLYGCSSYVFRISADDKVFRDTILDDSGHRHIHSLQTFRNKFSVHHHGNGWRWRWFVPGPRPLVVSVSRVAVRSWILLCAAMISRSSSTLELIYTSWHIKAYTEWCVDRV